MVTVYKQLYLNINSQPCTKTWNMTAVANDNSEHNHDKAPLDQSAFYIRSWRILSTKCIFSTKCSLSVKTWSGRLVSSSDPPPGLKGSLSMRLSGRVVTTAHKVGHTNSSTIVWYWKYEQYIYYCSSLCTICLLMCRIMLMWQSCGACTHFVLAKLIHKVHTSLTQTKVQ